MPYLDPRRDARNEPLSSQGERRFYLGAMVDDLFLSTNVFHFNGGESAVIPYDAVADSDNEGEKVSSSESR